MKITQILLCTFTLVACTHAPVKIETQPITWVTPVSRDFWLVRTLSDNCPTMEIGTEPVPLKPRFTTTEKFPHQVCEAMVARSAQPESKEFAIPKLAAHPKRIVIFGDTGCRIKIGKKVEIQACNDSEAWPFAMIATNAAAWKPDLVIHVGDYHYRDSECPKDHPECAGSVAGDNAVSWMQDFFTPAQPLLAAAPWIFVRGNHEICGRGGEGWFHFLDVSPYIGCTENTPPRTVSFPEKDFLVLDSANKENIEPSLKQATAPHAQTWLLTHRPLLTKGADDPEEWGYKLPAGWNALLSALFTGHVHLVSLNRFHDSRPPEFILGTGGSALGDLKQTPKQKKEADETVLRDFGFATLENQGGSLWNLTFHDRHGKDVMHCQWNESVRKSSGLKCIR